MNYKNLRIVFFGTPDFATASLRALVEAGCSVEAVVTGPDRPAGRGRHVLQSDVKRYASGLGMRILQPERLKAPEFIEELRGIDADLFVVVAFRMLPREVWQMPRLGTFNIHGSLLPAYRGAAPVNHAIMNGETRTGVTSFFLSHEIDTGGIIMQRDTEIAPDENVGSLYDRLAAMGAELCVDTVKAIADGTAVVTPQPEGEYPAAPKIFKDDCRIDWTRPAAVVYNKIRGLSPYPAAWTEIWLAGGKPLQTKIFAVAAPVEAPEGAVPGEVVTGRRDMAVVCAGGKMLPIIEIQPSGKARMTADAFLRGYTPARCD